MMTAKLDKLWLDARRCFIEGDYLNAARQLAAIFRMWEVPAKQSVFQARGSNGHGPDHPQLWSQYSQASAFMQEIEEAVRDMEESGESVAHYRSFIPRWWMALVAPETAWTSANTSTKPAATDADLALLDALAAHLERGVPKSKEPDQEAIDRIMAMLEEVADVAADEPDLAFAMKSRIAGLIRQVKDILAKYGQYSPEQLQHVLDELTGVTARAALLSRTPATQNRLLNLCGRLATSTVVGFFHGAEERVVEGAVKSLALSIGAANEPSYVDAIVE